MPLSKERMKERKRIDRLVKPTSNLNDEPCNCYSCNLATLYLDGRTRCDQTISETNLLGVCVQPNTSCPHRIPGQFKLYNGKGHAT